jgi:hypothetical protein
VTARGGDRIHPDDDCPICGGSFIIATSGPDYWGNYDTEDCPCQVVPDFDAEAFLAERPCFCHDAENLGDCPCSCHRCDLCDRNIMHTHGDEDEGLSALLGT